MLLSLTPVVPMIPEDRELLSQPMPLNIDSIP